MINWNPFGSRSPETRETEPESVQPTGTPPLKPSTSQPEPPQSPDHTKESKIILNPSGEERREPERDFTVTISLPKAISREILKYIDPQWATWYKELRQFDFEQRVDAKRAQEGLPPINPGRKDRNKDRDKITENFSRFDEVKRQYAESLYWGSPMIPSTLISFLDWRIEHKTGHIEDATRRGNKEDEKKNKQELKQLNKWRREISCRCPIKR